MKLGLLATAGAIGLLFPRPTVAQTIVAAAPYTSNVDGFIVTEGDIADEPYTELGYVSAKSGKITWVSKNPDRESVNQSLREKAKRLGATAVVRVRYSSTGVSAMSWGGMKGEGMAIRFNGAAK